MHDMIRGEVYEGPPADPSLMQRPPHVEVTMVHDVEPSNTPHGASEAHHGLQRSTAESYQLDVELRLPRPAVGVLNITGSADVWVKAPFAHPAQQV